MDVFVTQPEMFHRLLKIATQRLVARIDEGMSVIQGDGQQCQYYIIKYTRAKTSVIAV